MAKSPKQKLKLIYLMQIFLDKTDETHYITMADILRELENKDINAERKAIYDDLEALRGCGMEIEGFQEKGTYYYHLLNRKFELPELKLLVDAVQCSKFITLKKSNELIKKIESLSSEYEAKELQRQVYVNSRIKTMNESIYYNVDRLHMAINSNSQITFQYFEWTVDKKIKLKKNGDMYKVSPWALSWDNEKYYLIAYDSEEKKIKHFRVDKMLHIELADDKRDGRELFEQFDMADYSKKMFGMYGGKEETVKLEFENGLIGVIIDQFGKDTIIVPADKNHFTINVEIEFSRQFLAWVIGLGSGARIVSPHSVVDEMREVAAQLTEQYR